MQSRPAPQRGAGTFAQPPRPKSWNGRPPVIERVRLPAELIRVKRDGGRLEDDEIEALVEGIADGSLGDAQVGALAMAVYLRGMDMGERIALTRAMTATGCVLDWGPAGTRPPVLDKHSTGGIGDKVSLVLAPALAACGAWVPMISGRGLGHTGGTLDKLESIPGCQVDLALDRVRGLVRDVGCAIAGAGPELAPADRRLYAIRDVTATIESVDLITASILAKKLAEGLDALVMDVKTGSGAFASTRESARELAESIVTVASGAGVATHALVTDMGAVLGHAAGNAVEIAEAVAFLRGEGRDDRLAEVVLALGAEAMVLAGLEPTLGRARSRLERTLDGGEAAERFARMIAAQGGPTDLLERADARLPRAPVIEPVEAGEDGTVAALDARAVGVAVVELGGGRRAAGDAIDPAVGVTRALGPGASVMAGDALAVVHARDESSAARAKAAIAAAYRLADAGRAVAPVLERITPSR